MNDIQIGSKSFTGPSSWDDITPKQFLQLMNWQIKLGGDPCGRYALLQLWYGIRYRTARLLDEEQRVELVALLDFLDERPERWLLPTLRLRTRTYIGPGDGLDFLTYAEFMYAQSARDRYLATRETTHLADLAAALYRPKALFFQKAGDAQRSLFDARRHAVQARDMAGLPASVLQGILVNFEGCLDRFPQEYPNLFSGASDGDGSGTWLNVGLSLVRQTTAHGTFAQLEQTNLLLVLTTLDDIMKEAAELKSKLESHG